ncbi:fatty acid desaturase family protein [Reinekea sp.]|jgi:fatty acid desaturase|uniref:fatty acid desaturase family protein n=1 Tax=Reinekea sp. TaxID=1970455 RepID=UPI002A8288D2|nr:fatty acid desaturase [Reinekea sp.]
MAMNYIAARDLLLISGAESKYFSVKLVLYVLMISVGGSLAFNGGGYYWLGMGLIGLAIAHGVELQHQVLHGSAFLNKRVSHIVGFILGLPMLVSYSSYQFTHLAHHDKVGTEDDVEFFEFNTLNDEQRWYGKVSSFLLLSHYAHFLKIVFNSILVREIIVEADEETNRYIRREYLTMAFLIVVFVAVSVVFDNYQYLLLWLVPLALFAAPTHTLIELPEHFGCDNRSESILRNTRTIRSSPFFVWFTNGNNYHVEHHMFPLVRPEKLSILHRKMSVDIAYQNQSYFEFFMESI